MSPQQESPPRSPAPWLRHSGWRCRLPRQLHKSCLHDRGRGDHGPASRQHARSVGRLLRDQHLARCPADPQRPPQSALRTPRAPPAAPLRTPCWFSGASLLCPCCVRRRSDATRCGGAVQDRVECGGEQMAHVAQTAEQMSASTGRETRVVGWYHSHPHITALPSHIDIATQVRHRRTARYVPSARARMSPSRRLLLARALVERCVHRAGRLIAAAERPPVRRRATSAWTAASWASSSRASTT